MSSFDLCFLFKINRLFLSNLGISPLFYSLYLNIATDHESPFSQSLPYNTYGAIMTTSSILFSNFCWYYFVGKGGYFMQKFPFLMRTLSQVKWLCVLFSFFSFWVSFEMNYFVWDKGKAPPAWKYWLMEPWLSQKETIIRYQFSINLCS